ncbi:putative glucan 1,3-beta-glucosidase D [Psilocybe cubensis]|uniref:Glucan 1,3-beta-glucosidase D n=1 Tax=Psilocybe cubensis TaxID=181762 RepID=A0ACB8H0F1_PSICU|nr:putative glucan 1,3-beta-glucosidase D [Psilocybe cubensis]KAH9480680.1 putative glucan 1,3-beta-glucosidase D [Psilocybe cubensis]
MSHYKSVSLKEDHELSPSPMINSQADLQSDPWNDELLNMYQDDPPLSDRAALHPAAAASFVARAPSQSQRMASIQKRRKNRLIWLAIIAVILALGVVGAVVGVLVGKKGTSNETKSADNTGGSGGNGSGGTGGTGSGSGTGSSSLLSGTSGSKVTMEDGTTFVYTNDFGGEWAVDPKQPFATGGKAQSWSPRIGTEEWKWGTDYVRVTEPFIVPALYEAYIGKTNINVVDEWTLSQAMGSDIATKMEEHYKTFITEQDFAQIAGAGLNWVRIPIGFWAIETINDEPFLTGTSWTYFLKAIQWGRKYGIRIYLDLHALPGSQNGWNHSGKSMPRILHCGSVNFMNGVMGIANAERTLNYLRIITEFVSQPQYRDVVGIVGIVNEILWDTIGKDAVQSFYLKAYDTIRKSTGTGTGNGPYIAIHEGFQGVRFLTGADRLALDQHPVSDGCVWGHQVCEELIAFFRPNVVPGLYGDWAIATNQSQKVFGVTLGGEFSAAINNCGLWYAYTPDTIAALKNVALASMDALQNFFYWTWKIGNSTALGTSSSPMWHYQLGLQQGWIPKDPREAIGHCASVLGSSQLFDGNYPATATGGAGAGTVDPAQSTSHPFPPATISPSFSGTQVALLPTYTPTGTLKTLFAPTFTAAPSAVVGSGWNNPADNAPAFVPIAGCSYPNPWDAVSAALPTTTCTGP